MNVTSPLLQVYLPLPCLYPFTNPPSYVDRSVAASESGRNKTKQSDICISILLGKCIKDSYADALKQPFACWPLVHCTTMWPISDENRRKRAVSPNAILLLLSYFTKYYRMTSVMQFFQHPMQLLTFSLQWHPIYFIILDVLYPYIITF